MSSAPTTVQLAVPIAEPGMAVAFIASSMVAVPAVIESVNSDATVNLVAQIPRSEVQIDHVAHQRREGFTLVPTPFKAVMPTDPRAIVVRRAVALLEPMVSNEGQVMQTTTDQWVISGVSRLPRMHDIYTSLIGRWFDPSLWHYSIYCWKGPYKDIFGHEYPAVEETFPKKKEVYETYEATFKRYFKERFSDPSRWDRVEISAVIPA